MDATETAANTAALADVEAIAFLDRALALVDSPSIRAWAGSADNRPLLARVARERLNRGAGFADERRFAATITLLGIGA